MSRLIIPSFGDIFTKLLTSESKKINYLQTFPSIIHHFFVMVIMSYVLLLTIFMSCLLTFSTTSTPGETSIFQIPLIILSVTCITIPALTIVVINQMFHLLVFLLTVKNCCQYFFPFHIFTRFLSRRNLPDFIWYLYAFFFVNELIGIFLYWAHWFILSFEVIDVIIIFYQTAYMILNIILIFLCPVCYFPIILSLWKSSNLRSEEHIYLHNYMFWQSVLVLFFKFMVIMLIIFISTAENLIIYLIAGTIAFDGLTTPIIIQISYLGCNRNNLKILLTSFNFKKFFAVIFGCTGRNVVHPQVFLVPVVT
ncbi:Serpentine Receptor, class Z [Caenorhabditis elegans]|uniref:Serpentine Receptor, class Z n=1 Tax=Caenorhabditis elegans TaxID=6239 RepID=H2KY63_CAEEL|nr:Serpentine Receptor, class Z [Caenorhabditis elegans]CCD61296.1 Serpentine Receptor, class Z [Caenorhabditis elegans]|eukprot:NP_001020960.1 Serpentine Receptor, class Z [Caenorhabditis elegans]